MNGLTITEIMCLTSLTTAEIERIKVKIALNTIYGTTSENKNLSHTMKTLENLEQKLFNLSAERVK